MKLLAALLEDDKNIVMVPLSWLTREDRKEFIRDGYEVIPIPGYRESDGYRAFKIIGPYSQRMWEIREFSIPIWQDWKLTARYATRNERTDSTTGIQMFDRLDDDEKIQALTINWFQNAVEYIIKYFREHPDLLKRAKLVLKPKDINTYFKELF